MDLSEDSADTWPVLSWMTSCVMVFGGVLPYIPQYQEIRRTSNTDGFSTWVCFVLLIANILRIFFWFGKFFEVPLLLQSLMMIITMLSLLHLCCTVQTVNRVSTKYHAFTDFDIGHFWKWNRFEDYLQFCLSVTIFGALLTYILLDIPVFVEGLGLVALLIEAMLGLPQMLQNLRNKSTRGMSVKMVMLWTAGDCFKTSYFIIKATPVQFWLCGILQICLDVLILLQVWYYNQQPHVKFG
ncbi:solute carrier family 66 member 2-like isoform X1 [Hyla sarda]|uniref:solute carrier family 66 member 2-like isoform X1 n=1 Tax=Hyla sarda TaxID=327740 RepID=UPI0024C39D88|nr:solute carrier family 66 member 2-like isoform X1 [Hyla sarda]XP_056384332.1 solute carrier family 66 member 2-like isoform X1 [Hyla sarda]XP_056384333.1 solute carrier family 66 member 2-like isoform X1 [Hyla sarda]XP_056384335.1 solute carrier family 66 member 2-like isoform X1 [Hyla sarda]